MAEQSIWDEPPLAPEDQQLVEAYLRTGRSIDDLAYTKDFEELVKQLNYPDTLESRHFILQRLLRLRKGGRLPRAGRSSAETF